MSKAIPILRHPGDTADYRTSAVQYVVMRCASHGSTSEAEVGPEVDTAARYFDLELSDRERSSAIVSVIHFRQKFVWDDEDDEDDEDGRETHE